MQGAKVQWWEPYHETRKSSLEAIKQSGVLRLRLWIIMIFVPAAILVPVFAWFAHAVQGIVLPWRALFFGVLGLPFCILLHCTLFWLTPRFISMDQNGVRWSQGQTSPRIPRNRLRCAALRQHPDGTHWFVVELIGKNGATYLREFAVGRKVDLQALSALCLDLSTEIAPADQLAPNTKRSMGQLNTADRVDTKLTSTAR